jgi:intracellular sulfur oxidation DsrE/DsrF family protein
MSTNEGGQSRRGFLGTIASGAAAMGLATLAPFQQIQAGTGFSSTDPDPEQLFKNLKGKHRAIFDVTEPNQENAVMPFAWARVFLLTNEATGSKENDVVMVLRHAGIAYAFEDRLWAKYGFGEMFGARDAHSMEKKPATKNDFWKPEKGAFKFPGVGTVEVGINELQASGVHFVVCSVAMSVYSAVLADKMKMKHEDVLADFKAGLLPGVTPVPSGVWAVGRAQENKCAYFFAG